MSVAPEDLRDAGFVDAAELGSDGTAQYADGGIVAVASGVIEVSGLYLLDPTTAPEADDVVVIAGNTAADGEYTVDSVVDNTHLTVNESIVDGTGGTAVFRHPPGAGRVGVDPTNMGQTIKNWLQGVLEDLDAAIGAGGFADEKVKVSANDTTAGYLLTKLVEGTNVTFTEVDDGGDEALRIDVEVEAVAPVRSLDIAFHPMQIGENIWAHMSNLVFRGTNFMGTPTTIKVVAYSEDTNEPCDIRIIDVDNGGLVVAEVSVTAAVFSRVDMGVLTNLSSDETLWEIQAKHGDTRWADGWLSALSVQV